MAYANPYAAQGIETVHDGIGSRIGGAAWSATKGVAKVGWKIGKDVGKGAWWLGKQAGKGAYHLTAAVGQGAISAGSFTAGFAYKAMTPKYESTAGLHGIEKFKTQMRNTARAIGDPKTPIKAGMKFASGLIDYEPGRQVWNATKGQLEKRMPNLKLTGRGKLIVGGGALIASAIRGAGEEQQRRMGKVDTQTTTATPDYQPRQYDTRLDNGGASGDLVFALWANRHG